MMESEMTKEQITVQMKTVIESKKLPPLLHRDFVAVNSVGESGDAGQEVRVMQWNMLAQALCLGADNFIKCPKEALDWESRKWRVLEEILRYSPTVLCLQEVDHFEFLQSLLMRFGYMGVFFPKPDSPCLYSATSNGPDGCAVFYKSSLLTLVQSDSIVLKDGNGSNTNQVSIVSKYQTKTGEKEFFVAVTHLKAKSGYDKLRNEQAEYLSKYLSEKCNSHPVIICGDFNAAPTEAAYKTMQDSDLKLVSVYTLLSDSQSEPKYTTWKVRGGRGSMTDTCRTIDYIWQSQEGLKVKSILDVASDEEIGEDRLPKLSYPSDHLSLVCDVIVE